MINDKCRVCEKEYKYLEEHKHSINRENYIKSCKVCSHECLKKMSPKDRDIMFIKEFLREYVKRS